MRRFQDDLTVAIETMLRLTIVVSTLLSAIVSPAAATAEAVRSAAEQRTGSTGDSQAAVKATVVYLGKRYPEPPPLSLLDKVWTDEGLQGARIALKENNMTGRLLQQSHEMIEAVLPEEGDVALRARELLAAGHRLLLADLEKPDLLAVAALPDAADAIILNIRASDDELRGEECRRNVFHIIPSHAMRADALAQYLLWKKWRNWTLIVGRYPADQQYAKAVRRAASRFGAKIVEERSYAYDAGSRRTDSGHQQVQTQMPMLTQGMPAHDVVVVADIGEAFGEYLTYRTSEPRPVVGTHGLQAVAWHRSFEQYAGTQMQNRFERLAGRVMTERDYTGWLGTRVFGEAVTRIAKSSAADIRAYILSREFEVAAFKGQGLTFRNWDQQMRQPILLSGPRALVSISPQDGFLHPKFSTDTLGYDEPETACRFAK